MGAETDSSPGARQALHIEPNWQQVGVHSRRVTRPDFCAGVATEPERAVAVAAGAAGRQAQDYLAWRRSLLLVALVFLAVTAGISFVNFLIDLSQVGPEAESQGFNVKLFQLLAAIGWVAKVVLALSAWFALRRWAELGRSHRAVKLGWAVGFAVPFGLAMVPVASLFDLPAVSLQQMAQQQLMLQLMGLGMGIAYFIQLLPAILAVFVGVIRAALLVKRFWPEAAIPGWVASVAAPLLSLIALAAFVLIYQISGNLLLLFGFGCVCTNYLLYTRYGAQLARPLTHAELTGTLATIRSRGVVLVGVGGLCLVVSAFSVNILGTYLVGFEDPVMLGPLKLLEVLVDLIGRSLITALLFADLLLVLIQRSYRDSVAFRDGEYAAPFAERLEELEAAGVAELGQLGRFR